jgi:hypothetical protein
MFLEHFLDSFLESPRWHLLELEMLEERRYSLRLILLYKVVEGLVPALPTADFVTTAKPKMNIKAKVYKECETTNIIERRLIKNSKGIKVPDYITILRQNIITFTITVRAAKNVTQQPAEKHVFTPKKHIFIHF